MSSRLNKILDRVDLSAPVNFFLVLTGCVLTTCFLSDWISTTAFNLKAPQMMAVYEAEIREQTLITTLILSTLFFSIFLYLMKHIDDLRKLMAEQIRHDSLTGLLTREAFVDDFESQEVDETKDAFLIIDADLFKKINDTHGHIIGDKALIKIAEALKKGIRKTDTIGRIGGEEFVVHLKDVNYKHAVTIAERLRQNVKEANKSFEFEGVDLSVSIGAVIYDEDIDLTTLITKADELLYMAKDSGRNRVMHRQISKISCI